MHRPGMAPCGRDVFLPFVSLAELAVARARRHGDRRAYVFLEDGKDESAVLTFADLAEQAARGGAALARRGVQPGDRVLLLFPAGPDFVVAFFACSFAGAVAVPLPVPRGRRGHARLRHVMDDCAPALALTAPELLDGLRSAWGAAALPLVALERDEDAPADPPRARGDEVVFLQYTSGSTGMPRGVAVRTRNLAANILAIHAAAGRPRQAVWVTWLPTFHDMGLVGATLHPIACGHRIVALPPQRFLADPTTWPAAMSRYGATDCEAPNFGYELLADVAASPSLGGISLATVERAWCGAEPIQPSTARRFLAAYRERGLSATAFLPCYGLAEATLLATCARPARELSTLAVDPVRLEQGVVVPAAAGREIVSCGFPGAGFRLAIAEPEQGEPLPADRVGEVWLQGNSVPDGYWNDPSASAGTFGAPLGGEAGSWLRTGDLGFVHAGELFVCGRRKDVIIVRGRNLHPQDLEAATRERLAFVAANGVAAFPLADGVAEGVGLLVELDRRHARIARQAARDASARDAMQALAARAGQAVFAECEVVPATIAFVDPASFPRTTSGKVRRRAARQLVVDGAAELLVVVIGGVMVRPAPMTPVMTPVMPAPPPVAGDEARGAGVLRLLLDLLAPHVRFGGAGGIDPDAEWEGLGVDSLKMLLVVRELEKRLGVSILLESLQSLRTPRAWAEHLAGGAAVPSPAVEPPPATSTWEERLHRGLLRSRRWRAAGRYAFGEDVEPAGGPWVECGGRRLLMLGSYSYLGLLHDHRLREAAVRAIATYGTGSHGARLLTGTSRLHHRLEQRLARTLGAADAMVFTSGFVANHATITALVGPGDVVIGDELNHASIVAGCRASGAQFRRFRHGDPADLERELRSAGGRTILVVVDAVFSMEGDIADLPAISRLCRNHGALLMVDEAHSFGVLGRRGRGIREHFGLPDDAVDVTMGTLSKALASAGGFVAGNADLIEYLRHHASGYVFSGALANAEVAAAEAALDVLEAEPDRLARLHALRARYVEGLCRAGFDVMQSATPIVPIRTRDEAATLALVQAARERGLFVVPVFHPAVPQDAPRLRTCVTADLTERDVDFAVLTLVAARDA